MTDKNHILIVDDEPNVRFMFRTALEAAENELLMAENGREALELLASSRVDLVLLDLLMPEVDGMETLRRIRDAGTNVPVIIVTAHGSVPHAVEAMKLGAIDFLSKPLRPDVLRQIVTEVLDRHGRSISREMSRKPTQEPVTAEVQFATNLSKAKRALNRRGFEEAEVFLKQAIALKDDSAEAHNLMGVLHELRNEHDASYRSYKAALKADKHYEPARHNMTRYYERFTFGRSDVPVDTGET